MGSYPVFAFNLLLSNDTSLLIIKMREEVKNNFQIRNKSCPSRKSQIQSGFSLIEVMVAAMILSIGILGVASLQVVGLKGTHQSTMKIQAMNIVSSLTERMHANKLGVTNGSYVDSSANFVCNEVEDCSFTTANCTSAQIAKIDLDNLICGYKAGTANRRGGIKSYAVGDQTDFFNGDLNITCPTGDCASGQVRISMEWQEQKFGNENADSILPTKDSIVVNTRIFR